MSAPYTAFAHVMIIFSLLNNLLNPSAWVLSILLMLAAIGYATISTKATA